MGEMTSNLQTGGDKKCPNCTKAIGGNMLYCPYCGSNTNPAPNNRGIICDKCGKTSPLATNFVLSVEMNSIVARNAAQITPKTL